MVDVERVLVDLGGRLDYPRGDDLAEAVVARIEGDAVSAVVPRPGRWAVPVVAAAAVLALVVIAIAVPGPREAIARWFGIGGVRFELRGDDPLPAELGSDFDLGEPVAARDAADAVNFEIRLPDDPGPPAAAFAGRPPGGITMVWPPSAALPEVGDSGVGLLLTEFHGSTTDTLVVKELGAGTRLEPVVVDGADGYWITGAPHVVTYLDPHGEPRFDATRLAGNTLLWEVDGVTHRMESALGLEAMVQLAASLRPVG